MAAALTLTTLVAIRYAAGAATAQPALPSVLAAMRDFRGRIQYVVKPDDASVGIDGTLVIDSKGWSLDERSSAFDLHADARSATLSPAVGSPVIVDDVFASDVLSNAWAPMLGESATSPVASTDRPGLWDAGDLRIFLDPSGSQVIGFRDGRDDVAYALDDWWMVGPLDVPHRILRLRGGEPQASYSVSDYVVAPTLEGQAAPPTPPVSAPLMRVLPQQADDAPIIDVAWAQRAAAIAFALLVLALGIVAWTRRDALIGALCVRIARDPRAWRTAGVSVFVEPDGTMTVDGSRYRVGPAFFGRAVLVQRSILFVRVSSPAVPHVVILPRKFTRVELGVADHRARRSAAGFTLVETMVATALFAAVVLLAVYPAIAAVARADLMAAERSRAVVIASNALADEEAASAYGTTATFGTTTSSIDGLTLTVSVTPGTIRDESDLDVIVEDGTGVVLAHVVSWLGVAVNPPPDSGGGPPDR